MCSIIYEHIKLLYSVNQIEAKAHLTRLKPTVPDFAYSVVGERLKAHKAFKRFAFSTADDRGMCRTGFAQLISELYPEARGFQLCFHLSRLAYVYFLTWAKGESSSDFGPRSITIFKEHPGPPRTIALALESAAKQIISGAGWMHVNRRMLERLPPLRTWTSAKLRWAPVEVLFSHWRGSDGRYKC